MKSKLFLSIVFFYSFSLFAHAQVSAKKEEIIGKYKRTLMEYNGVHHLQFQKCNSDDELLFKKDGYFSINYGKVKCSEIEKDLEEGTWSFNEELGVIIIDCEIYGVKRHLQCDILALKNGVLQIKYVMEDKGQDVVWLEQLKKIK